jgi:hypothetical protein
MICFTEKIIRDGSLLIRDLDNQFFRWSDAKSYNDLGQARKWRRQVLTPIFFEKP